jgi:protein SCO1/2
MSENTKAPPKFNWLHALYAFFAILIITLLWFSIFKPIKVLPRISLAPGYALINQDNEPRTSEDYRGKLTLYSFTYTHCAPDCPQDVRQLSALRDALETSTAQNVDYAFVTVSLDPERDTPEALRLFAAPMLDTGEHSVGWDFLTGDPQRIRYMVGGGFELFYETEADPTSTSDYKINFYPRYVLVDGWGIIRAEYRTDSLDPDEVLSDINYLIDEIDHAQGAAKYAYEAAHLFRCYP